MKRLLTLAMFPLLFAACHSHGHSHDDDGETHSGEVKEHRDQWRPREAQSDFLDIGMQASIEWLSFVPQDQLDYPEYFEGLDRDQKQRLRLAPKGSDEQVLLEFDLPEDYKLWPVDWYGTELMAIDNGGDGGWQMSVALAKDDGRDPKQIAAEVASQRTGKPVAGNKEDGQTVLVVTTEEDLYLYGAKRLIGRTASFVLVVEDKLPGGSGEPVTHWGKGAIDSILRHISINREIGLEGSPKHKCTSTLDEQLAGTLRFPDGVLQLGVTEDQLVRKIGGGSTIQIDGEGAKPWILLRRLKKSETEGDLRARLRRDTTFNRRLKVASGKFSTGYVAEGAMLPIVCFDYDDSAAESNLLGILKAGSELITFEVVTRGVRDGDKRRAAKAAALKLLSQATGDPATEAPGFEPLIGWNVGNMGRDE